MKSDAKIRLQNKVRRMKQRIQTLQLQIKELQTQQMQRILSHPSQDSKKLKHVPQQFGGQGGFGIVSRSMIGTYPVALKIIKDPKMTRQELQQVQRALNLIDPKRERFGGKVYHLRYNSKDIILKIKACCPRKCDIKGKICQN